MKKGKKGFSIELYSKNDVENYTVYFEEKHNKIVYCYLYDSFLDITFRSKSICHRTDEFDSKKGKEISFIRCMDKRTKHYDILMKNILTEIETVKDHSYSIIKKGFKFINEN